MPLKIAHLLDAIQAAKFRRAKVEVEVRKLAHRRLNFKTYASNFTEFRSSMASSAQISHRHLSLSRCCGRDASELDAYELDSSVLNASELDASWAWSLSDRKIKFEGDLSEFEIQTVLPGLYQILLKTSWIKKRLNVSLCAWSDCLVEKFNQEACYLNARSAVRWSEIYEQNGWHFQIFRLARLVDFVIIWSLISHLSSFETLPRGS